MCTTFALCCAAAATNAQEAPPPPPPPAVAVAPEGPPPFAERIEILGFDGMDPLHRKVVTGQPFSAVAVSETVQVLADGNRIDRKTQATLYRDSQGRTRRETTFSGIGPLAAEGKAHTMIAINDPVAKKAYILNPTEKIAHVLPSGRRFMRDGNVMFFRKGGRVGDANLKTDSLGTQTIAGISAEGTRYTRTIPAGQIGNEKPIVVTSEQWYSADLQITVMSKRDDPRFGETTYTLSNIQRHEPDASLFAVPSDYTVSKNHRGRGMRAVQPGPSEPPTPAPQP
jgi:hypothetical protein